MSALPQSERMTEAEYLAFGRESENHNLVNVNLVVSIKTRLRGKPCKVYANDMRVRIASLQMYTYPDISLVCDRSQLLTLTDVYEQVTFGDESE